MPINGLNRNNINFSIINKQYPTLGYPERSWGKTTDGNDFTYDWGDGTKGTYKDGDDVTQLVHTYKPGTYLLSINGKCPKIINSSNWSYNYTEYRKTFPISPGNGDLLQLNCNYGWIYSVVELVSWGFTGLTNLDMLFSNCTKLRSIPILDNIKSLYQVQSLYYTFFNCTSLTTIPYDNDLGRGLFDNCVSLRNVEYVFLQSRLIGDLPKGLFAGCVNLNNCSSAFKATKIISIPSNMFDNCPSITNIQHIFQKCYNLTSNPGVFKSNNITNISYAFSESAVTGTLDDSLFTDKLTDASFAFYNCKNIDIASNALRNLKNCILQSTFYNSSVKTCPDISGLTGCSFLHTFYNSGINKFPSNTFDGLTKDTNLKSAFGGVATNVEGNAPTNIIDCPKWTGILGGKIFANQADIPSNLGGTKYNNDIGKIMLNDNTLVTPKDFKYDKNNPPKAIIIGIAYIAADGTETDEITNTKKMYAYVLQDDIVRRWFTLQETYSRKIGDNAIKNINGNYNSMNGLEVTNALLKDQEDQGWSDDTCPVYKHIKDVRNQYGDNDLYLATQGELVFVYNNFGNLEEAFRVMRNQGIYPGTPVSNSFSSTVSYAGPNASVQGIRIPEVFLYSYDIWWANCQTTIIKSWTV